MTDVRRDAGPAPVLTALRGVALLAPLSDEALERYAGRGTERQLAPGDSVARQGDQQAWFQLLLRGRVEWTRRVGASQVHVLTHTAGMYFGHEPILLDIPVPVSGQALEPSWIFQFEGDAFWELLASCPAIRGELLSTVTQRVQTLESVSQHQAKLAALGTLAAGLAHELNNPAAAVRQGAAALGRTLAELASAAPRLGAAVPDAAQLDVVRRVYADAAAALSAPAGVVRSPLQVADEEDELVDWLEDQGVGDAVDRAATLVRAGVGVGRLEELSSAVGPAALQDVLAWLTASLGGVEVLGEVQQGAERISELVQAMRDYTYLDQGPLQEVDVHAGLESTLTILRHKLGGIDVVRDYAPDLPRVSARGSELNQVWTNVLDNAIDAMAGGPRRPDGTGGDGVGTLTLRTRSDGPRILVEVSDTGPGIPADLLERIFEPYFTTRAVGAGTGLGLDIARRIVSEAGGDIRVWSAPGDTRFEVRLPLGRAT